MGQRRWRPLHDHPSECPNLPVVNHSSTVSTESWTCFAIVGLATTDGIPVEQTSNPLGPKRRTQTACRRRRGLCTKTGAYLALPVGVSGDPRVNLCIQRLPASSSQVISNRRCWDLRDSGQECCTRFLTTRGRGLCGCKTLV